MLTRTRLRRRDVLAGLGATALMSVSSPFVLRSRAAEPFRIGALNPITGSGGAYGAGMQKIIAACAEAVNAAGGAGGRMLEVFAEDTQTQPEAAVLAARKLVDVNRVDAILGTWSSGVTLAVMNSVTQPAGIIHMNVSGADAITTDDKKDIVWRFSPIAYSFGVIYAKLAAEKGYKRAVVMQFNNASAEAQANGFKDTWPTLGGEIVDAMVYEDKQPSYRSELQRALSSNPDVIILAGYSADSIIILREWYQTGVPTKFIMPSWAADQKLIDALSPEIVDGIDIVASIVASDSSAYKTFDEMYQAATGDAGASNKYAAMCYDMVNVLALAMEAAGPDADRMAINGKIRDIANPPGTTVGAFAEGKAALAAGPINYEGASSKVDFDKDGNDSGSVFAWNTISNGEITAVKTVSTA